ncbi:MAG TPA: ABC transporter permease, partial [Alphaproteobacteria bacterium]|nr:ABC transporter permease [Alphaproteobacteria bacterium]
MWQRIFSLIVKEILAVWRDPRSRFVLIGPPLLQLFVFSYAATYDVRNITIAVLNQDDSLAARELVARFTGAPAFAHVVRLHREAEIGPTIDAKRAHLVLHIGQDFGADLLARPPARVQLVLDGRMSNTALVLQAYATSIITGFAADWAAEQGLPGLPATVVSRAWYNPNLESLWVVVPGLVGILTMVVALVVTALSVAREREVGTFEQLLVTPLRPWEVVLGKTTPALLFGLGEGSLILVMSQLWFHVPFTGSLALLYLGLAVFLLAVIGVGLFISSLARTQQQAILGAFLLLVPIVVLSGFATPVANMPDWLQVATLANPLRHFLVLVQGLFLKNLPAALVIDSLWPLAAIAAITLAGSVLLFRRRL